MNYLTNYYKNLCENLQSEIILLEAGLKKALRTGNPALMQQELAKRKARMDYYRGEEKRFNEMPGHKGASEAFTKFSQAEALKPGILDLDMPLSSMGIKTGTKQSYLPLEMPWHDDLTPDQFDGPDEDNTGSAEEVQAAQQQNQFTGNIKPFPTPSEMSAFKLRTGKAFNQY